MFKPGDMVWMKKHEGHSVHSGPVVKQVGECVLWNCEECDGMLTENLEEDLEMWEDE